MLILKFVLFYVNVHLCFFGNSGSIFKNLFSKFFGNNDKPDDMQIPPEFAKNKESPYMDTNNTLDEASKKVISASVAQQAASRTAYSNYSKSFSSSSKGGASFSLGSMSKTFGI